MLSCPELTGVTCRDIYSLNTQLIIKNKESFAVVVGAVQLERGEIHLGLTFGSANIHCMIL